MAAIAAAGCQVGIPSRHVKRLLIYRFPVYRRKTGPLHEADNDISTDTEQNQAKVRRDAGNATKTTSVNHERAIAGQRKAKQC